MPSSTSTVGRENASSLPPSSLPSLPYTAPVFDEGLLQEVFAEGGAAWEGEEEEEEGEEEEEEEGR